MQKKTIFESPESKLPPPLSRFLFKSTVGNAFNGVQWFVKEGVCHRFWCCFFWCVFILPYKKKLSRFSVVKEAFTIFML